MKLIADLHCHSVASGHAYSTIMENIKEANDLGLYAIATTDHADIAHNWYFNNLVTIPREVLGVKVLRGIEANILNKEGDLDIPIGAEKVLDWVIASMHQEILKFPMNIDDCTNAWLNIANNPIVNVIGHSGRYDFRYNYERVIPEFGRKGKLVEINNSSLYPFFCSTQKCREIAILCKKHEVKVILNTDTHFCKQIGKFENAIKLLEEIDFPEELVVNSSVERLENYLREYTKFFRTP